MVGDQKWAWGGFQENIRKAACQMLIEYGLVRES